MESQNGYIREGLEAVNEDLLLTLRASCNLAYTADGCGDIRVFVELAVHISNAITAVQSAIERIK